MKLFLALRYLRHRLGAKNRHGLHSPYIYNLLDKIVYDFSPNPAYADIKRLAKSLPPNQTSGAKIPEKVNKLLYRLVRYFHPDALAVADNLNAVTALYLQQAVPSARKANWEQSADVMVCDAANPPAMPETFKPGAVLIITNIHADASTRAFWQQVKQQPSLNVTADLFWLGLAFNRPGQVEEEFKLRF